MILWRVVKSAKCPLLALSGLFVQARYMSAFEGKVDILDAPCNVR
jgi:hypothetical protein